MVNDSSSNSNVNAGKNNVNVTNKYVVFIQPDVVFHFQEDFILEPAKLQTHTTQQCDETVRQNDT